MIKADKQLYNFEITAVIDNIPENSSYRFNYLANINILLNIYAQTEWVNNVKTNWNFNFCKTFILFKNKYNADSFKDKWDKFEQGVNFPDDEFHYSLQKISDIHFNSEYLSYEPQRGNKIFILLYSAIALIILLVAVFNYIMLSISNSELRLKEIGIKKVLGSSSSILRRQFLFESVLISLISFPFAYLLVKLGIEKINQMFFINLEITILHNSKQLLSFLFITVMIGLISGSYISYTLSGDKAIDGIINNKSFTPQKKSIIKKGLIVFQIIVFTVLIGCSLSIAEQIHFLKTKNPGYNRTNKVIFNSLGSKFSQSLLMNFKRKLLESPDIYGVTSGWGLPPTTFAANYMIPIKDHAEEKIKIKGIITDANFANLLEIKIVQGRFFDKNLRTDSSACIINEKAAKMLGFSNPLNEKIDAYNIIGVISDFHKTTTLDDIDPLFLVMGKAEYITDIILDIRGNSINNVKNYVETIWNNIRPGERFFLKDIQEGQNIIYYKEDRLKKIIMFFSVIAIFLASIGLFAQSLFSIQQKRKEIGIRKVNGAKSSQIAMIFVKDYGFFTLIANIISWPLIFFFNTKWQQNFIYKNHITLGFIISIAGLSLAIVILTIVVNVIKRANEDPVKVLKYE